jgi:hypothetical protein
MRKRKNKKWFIAVRGSYLPNSWQGWLMYAPFLAYLLWAVWAGLKDTDNYTTAIMFILPNWVAAAVVMTWLAKRAS